MNVILLQKGHQISNDSANFEDGLEVVLAYDNCHYNTKKLPSCILIMRYGFVLFTLVKSVQFSPETPLHLSRNGMNL